MKKFAGKQILYYLCTRNQETDCHNGDSLAQQVEHNTFNVGVLGSSPRRITKSTDRVDAFFYGIKRDSLAQQVEHNTFNVGVLGSSPRRITRQKDFIFEVLLPFFYLSSG